MRPFVFLDRDGTLIVEKNYLADPDAVELIPGAAAALRRLRDRGFGVALVTNQSGVGRGYFPLERVHAVHQRVCELLAFEGAAIDAVYICPHTPEEACGCRKPRAGMIDRADLDHKIDREASFIIGDKESDIACGREAGLTAILVRTGYGSVVEASIGARADYVAATLVEAVDWILSRSGRTVAHDD
jgi:D-glycero-D-manno-heptose 1,7-bisphosphate phosphatase